ncbi:MAG TPA: PD-(D/E)XK nuclease family protein [Candidatus Polarisedimenticolaceae bacterium]
MRVLAHLDPWTLETHLLDRLEEVKRADSLAPVLLIVPTRRLADHLARRIAERMGAAVGVEVLHHRALAGAILEAAGHTPPDAADPLLLEALLEEALRGLERASALAGFVLSRGGATTGLLGTLAELREAGIPPDALEPLARSDREREVAAIYRRFTALLEAARARGLADDAVRACAALPHARAYGARFRAIFHHGAYELVGMNLDLVRELDADGRVAFLLPAAPGRAVSAYAESFARRYLLREGERVEGLDLAWRSRLGSRLADLYDEGARPSPLDDDAWSIANAQGSRTELRWGLRSKAGVADGPAPRDVAITARTLAPFASAIDRALDDARFPCEGPPGRPLRADPHVGDLLALLRVVADDFPRPATAELLRSPRLAWDRLAPDAAPVPGTLAEGWSREASIPGGFEAWTRDLPAWAGTPRTHEDEGDDAVVERRDAARRIAAAVRALAAHVAAATRRSWSGHADAVEALVARVFEPGAARAVADLLAPVLGAARARERVLGQKAAIPARAFVLWLEEAAGVARAKAPDRPGGFLLADVMQLRGCTFEHVHLAGLQSGVWPRIPREDPYLPDAWRTILRESLGRPLSVKSEGDREEHLLLALALGSARTSLALSWTRADDDGKARVASPALREIARVLLGVPDAKALRRRARAVPSHPREQIRAFAEGTGFVTPDEERLLVALEGEGDAAGRAPLLARAPELAPHLEMLAATESFAPGDCRFDARVPAPTPRAWSVTSLERLGRCALQFFFADVLRARPLAEEPQPFASSLRETGERVHALLEGVYAQLDREGAFTRLDPDALAARGRTLLDDLWEPTFGAAAERTARSLPLLHAIETSSWRQALRRFVEEDLRTLAGASSVRLEHLLERTLDLGEDRVLVARGKLDRAVERDATRTVADYKTSGDLEARLDVEKMLTGERLQVPLYHLLAGRATVALLGVGPAYDADGSRPAPFAGFPESEQEAGFRETLRVLSDLPRAGVFPLREGRHCSWCEFRPACRKGHPPTASREELAADGTAYRAVSRKRKKKPLLRDVGEDES